MINLHLKKKMKYPIYNQNERKKIIASLKYVDKVFIEESFEKKREYILENKADVLIMGDDWKNKFNEFKDICKIVYLSNNSPTETGT